MCKSDQARRFIALPNVVKCSPRDTHGKQDLSVLRILDGYLMKDVQHIHYDDESYHVE